MGPAVLESTSLYLARFDLRLAAFQTEPDSESTHPDVDSLRLSFRDINLPLSLGSLRLSGECLQRAANFYQPMAACKGGVKTRPTDFIRNIVVISDVGATGRSPLQDDSVHPARGIMK